MPQERERIETSPVTVPERIAKIEASYCSCDCSREPRDQDGCAVLAEHAERDENFQWIIGLTNVAGHGKGEPAKYATDDCIAKRSVQEPGHRCQRCATHDPEPENPGQFLRRRYPDCA